MQIQNVPCQHRSPPPPWCSTKHRSSPPEPPPPFDVPLLFPVFNIFQKVFFFSTFMLILLSLTLSSSVSEFLHFPECFLTATENVQLHVSSCWHCMCPGKGDNRGSAVERSLSSMEKQAHLGLLRRNMQEYEHVARNRSCCAAPLSVLEISSSGAKQMTVLAHEFRIMDFLFYFVVNQHVFQNDELFPSNSQSVVTLMLLLYRADFWFAKKRKCDTDWCSSEMWSWISLVFTLFGWNCIQVQIRKQIRFFLIHQWIHK